MTTSDLPPIGSLWLHRESGERRFVTDVDPRMVEIVYFSTPKCGTTFKNRIDNWLVWQAGAVRIDREEA